MLGMRQPDEKMPSSYKRLDDVDYDDRRRRFAAAGGGGGGATGRRKKRTLDVRIGGLFRGIPQ
jgi:hypothetical protein